MDNRVTTLGVRFPPDTKDHSFLELDLRGCNGTPLLGRRGQLQVTTRLVFKGEDQFRQHESVFQLWADVQVSNQAQAQLPDMGRAYVRDPVFFTPEQAAGRFGDPWTRSHDRLVLELDYQQLDEIEAKREGGPLTFRFTIGGTLQHDGRVAPLNPNVHQLTYEVGASDWTNVLMQCGYGTYLSLEVPMASPNGQTKEVRQAAQSLQEAVAAFRRGEYAEAIADCRPGIEALRDADQGMFDKKWLDREAGWDERTSWVVRSSLSIASLAHHPNDPAVADNASPATPGRPNRADAEAVIRMLATLVQWRMGRG